MTEAECPSHPFLRPCAACFRGNTKRHPKKPHKVPQSSNTLTALSRSRWLHHARTQGCTGGGAPVPAEHPPLCTFLPDSPNPSWVRLHLLAVPNATVCGQFHAPTCGPVLMTSNGATANSPTAALQPPAQPLPGIPSASDP
uniref:Uncharacterized protein n=1 Tax=Eutreptiella gymnastica TaxID=73025 RepID=A0A7S4GIT4_9EUGL